MRLFLILFAGCAQNDGPAAETGEAGAPDADADGFDTMLDCDDADPDVFPGASELPRDGIDNDCDPTTCGASGFAATPSALTLPTTYGEPGGQPFDVVAGFANCADDSPSHGLADLDGDGRRDLFVSFVCGDDEATGDTQWLAHLATTDGFAADPTLWTLPAEYGAAGAAPFVNAIATAVCGDGIPAHFLRDLDRDGLADMVVTEVCGEDAVGRTEWWVHRGTPTGFAAAAVAWPLPTGHGDPAFVPFAGTSALAACAKGIPAYTLMDATGDGLEDIVVTQSCTDPTIGSTRWDVHANDGAGFVAAAPFALPPEYAADGHVAFPAPRGVPSCGDGVPRHDSVDLDGDGGLDLIVTEACDSDESTGDSRWLVYRGTASGFEALATDWPLPLEYGAEGTSPFSSTVDVKDTGDDTPGHELRDMDGDGRPDLLVTHRSSDPTLGKSRWAVHWNEGDHFAEAQWTWTLPASGGESPFGRSGSSPDCAGGGPAWVLDDTDGNGLPELLLTAQCDDPALGDTRWDQFPALCEQ